MKILVGCIKILTLDKIGTRFIYVDTDSGFTYNVTDALCKSIDTFNKAIGKVRIPYKYENGLAVYKNGYGLTHVFEPSIFKNIWTVTGERVTFPLPECTMDIYTPEDIKNILKCKDAYDPDLIDAVTNHYKKIGNSKVRS